MAGQPSVILNKTTLQVTTKGIPEELQAYCGLHISDIITNPPLSDEVTTNATNEYKQLLCCSKELHEKFPQEHRAQLTTPIRGVISLEDPLVHRYSESSKSSLVKIIADCFAGNQGDKAKAALQELHGLLIHQAKLTEIQMKKGPQPTDPKQIKPRAAAPPAPPGSGGDRGVPMDTQKSSGGTRKKAPDPKEFVTSMVGGKCFVQVPLIELQQMNRRIESQQRDIDELTSRLSRFASNQVTQGNPNIADLSDRNRPTKIGEKFGGLYDDEWSEAFEAFKKMYKIEEEEDEIKVICQLLWILQCAQTFCEKIAKEQLDDIKQRMQTSILEVSSSQPHGEKCTQKSDQVKGLPAATDKYARNLRKECALNSAPAVAKLFIHSEVPQHFEWAKTNYPQPIGMYMEKCVELIWLMSVQDPPMFLASANDGDKMRTDMYSYYGSKGKVVKATVWPAVLLHKEGPIISKGFVMPHPK